MADHDWREIHASTLVVDGLDCTPPTEEYARALRAAGVGCVHLTVEDQDPRGGAHPFDAIDALLAQPGSSFGVARSVAEVEALHAAGRLALVLGWQGADPLGVEHGTLPVYVERGLRIIGITYNTANRYGGGCLKPQEGLTDDGRALVDEVGRLGLLLDVGGHTGERASLEAIERSAGRPVICSHTALATVNLNRRNTSDAVCEAIAGTGGVVGVLAINDFLVRNPANAHEPVTPRAPLDRMLDHLDHLRRLVGADHVGLGPDFVSDVNLDVPGAWPGIRFEPDMIGEGNRIDYVEGFAAIDQLPNVTIGLLRRGWPAEDVRKALGENWLRVYHAAWGA
jgi:membrane dipeptidase